MTALLSVLLLLQGQEVAVQTVTPLPAATATTVQATRTAQPPVVDGRDTDPVWATTPVIDQFLEARPTEGAPPKFRTEARVAYDEQHLYVFVRSFDPHPDSIASHLARRDEDNPSDYVTLMLDPYHDRRTGYEFTVNPAGVKADYAISNDGDEDVAWDAVWDVGTSIDSLGWTAEYRIPLSQLNYSSSSGGRFGVLFWRVIQRHTATVTWPLYRTSRSGLSSQFGELTGLEGLGRPERAEVTPYVVAKSEPDLASPDLGAATGPHPGWRREVPHRLQRAAQCHHQPRFRAGGGGPLGAQPQRVRDLLRGAPAVLRGGEGTVHLPGELRGGGRLSDR